MEPCYTCSFKIYNLWPFITSLIMSFTKRILTIDWFVIHASIFIMKNTITRRVFMEVLLQKVLLNPFRGTEHHERRIHDDGRNASSRAHQRWEPLLQAEHIRLLHPGTTQHNGYALCVLCNSRWNQKNAKNDVTPQGTFVISYSAPQAIGMHVEQMILVRPQFPIPLNTSPLPPLPSPPAYPSQKCFIVYPVQALRIWIQKETRPFRCVSA